MPVFQYVARNEGGKDMTGVLLAPNEDVLYETLRKQGLFLLQSRKRGRQSFRPTRIKISQKQLLAFTIHISTYQQAGITLMQTLQALSRESSGVKFQSMIEGIITRISGGSTFSEALAQYPRVFDKHYIQMVITGEAAGQLDARMGELVAHLEWQQEVRSQVRQSSTYPVILVAMLLGVVTLLMTFTLPKFVKLLMQFNVPLPAPTRIVIAASNLFSQYWYLLPLLVAAPFAINYGLKCSDKGRLLLDRIKLSLPLLGPLQRKIAMSRFAHTYSCLYAAGIETLSALSIVEELVGNLVIGNVIARVRQGVSEGKSISQQLAQSSEFPPFLVHMMSAGEEIGDLDSTLRKVSQYYDREIPAAIKRAFSIFEPLILVAMGALVAFIALSILLPIYQFGASINK